MLCQKCNKPLTVVYSTKDNDNEIVRYRKCECGYRFKTIEKSIDGWNTDIAIRQIKQIVNKF